LRVYAIMFEIWIIKFASKQIIILSLTDNHDFLSLLIEPNFLLTLVWGQIRYSLCFAKLLGV